MHKCVCYRSHGPLIGSNHGSFITGVGLQRQLRLLISSHESSDPHQFPQNSSMHDEVLSQIGGLNALLPPVKREASRHNGHGLGGSVLDFSGTAPDQTFGYTPNYTCMSLLLETGNAAM